jgi:exodeoxyribonuclease-3
MDKIAEAGFLDSFRQFDDGPENYSWWTYRMNARQRNIGWRLDYFWVAKRFWPRVQSAAIRNEVLGSDHCPVEITLSR